MAEIISFDSKQQLSEEKKAVLIRRQKILAVRKIIQCSRCPFKCKKCGMQINPNRQNQNKDVRLPYALCETCTEEYMDYIGRIQGKGDPDCYWHNDDWIDSWRKWIDYQGSVDRYLKSKEFTKLLQELRQQPVLDE